MKFSRFEYPPCLRFPMHAETTESYLNMLYCTEQLLLVTCYLHLGTSEYLQSHSQRYGL
jgi:hypothetical protein